MKMSVSTQEIAEHLVEELGHQEALQKCRYHLDRCRRLPGDKTANIWQNIDMAVQAMPVAEQAG